jgi:hypothetical protein
MPTLLRISSGVIVWALHFGFLYGFTALACARGFPHVVPWVVGGATVAAGLAAALIILKNLSADFNRWLAAALAVAALLAILWEGLTVFMVPMCE